MDASPFLIENVDKLSDSYISYYFRYSGKQNGKPVRAREVHLQEHRDIDLPCEADQ